MGRSEAPELSERRPGPSAVVNPMPPRETVAALRQYDPRLRLRWAVRTQTWFIECPMPPRSRAYLGEKPNPFHSPKGLDLFDSWREGYLHVMTVHPDLVQNVPLVLRHIAEADSYRHGSFEALNRRLDEAEMAWRAEGDAAAAHFVEQATSEAFERLRWRPATEGDRRPPESQRTEVHEGFVVHMRRGRADASAQDAL